MFFAENVHAFSIITAQQLMVGINETDTLLELVERRQRLSPSVIRSNRNADFFGVQNSKIRQMDSDQHPKISSTKS